MWFHPPTPNTPGRRGVLGRHPIRRCPRRCVRLGRRSARRAAAADRRRHPHRGPARSAGGRRSPEHDGRPPPPADPQALPALGVAPEPWPASRPICGHGPRPSWPTRSRKARCDFLAPWQPSSRCRRLPRLLGVPQDDRHLMFEWANATLDYEDRDLGQLSDASMAKAAEMVRLREGSHRGQAGSPHRRPALRSGGLEPRGGQRRAVDVLPSVDRSRLGDHQKFTGRRHGRLAADRSFVGRPRSRPRSLLGTATEEILRWASSTTYNRRTATTERRNRRHADRSGRQGHAVVGLGQLRRARLRRPVSLRHPPRAQPPPGVRARQPFLPGRPPGPHRDPPGARRAARPRSTRSSRRGPIEWVRSNKHTGVRHLPMRLVTR